MTAPAAFSPLLTCFVSASSQTNTGPVIAALADAGVRVRTSDDIPLGQDVSTALGDAVLAVDFVCVVVDPDSFSSTVAFEAGVAAGSRRPIIVVVEGRSDALETGPLSSMPRITYSLTLPNGQELLSQTVAAYVRNVQPIASQLQVEWGSWLGDDARPHKALNSIIRAEGYEKIVADRLVRAGGVVNTQVDGVDIVATFPLLGAKNNVAIEVKSRRTNAQGVIRRDLSQLYSAMLRSHTFLGLLVYSDDSIETRVDFDSNTLMPEVFGGILVTTVKQLLSWSDNEFLREVTRLRNVILHGSR